MIYKLLHRLGLRNKPQVLSSLEAYAIWAEGYLPYAHNPLMQAEQEAVLALLPDLNDKSILDLACGTGRYGLIAQEQGARFVVGVDNSPEMLRNAQLAFAILGSTEHIPLADQSMDVVISGLALGHLPTLGHSLSEIHRVLRPDGIAVISDVHPELFHEGGYRTFQSSDGQILAVEHHVHSIEQYRMIGQQVGLSLENVEEAHLSSEHRNQTEQPVAIAYHFSRTSLL